jgi:hypothetical protein
MLVPVFSLNRRRRIALLAAVVLSLGWLAVGWGAHTDLCHCDCTCSSLCVQVAMMSSGLEIGDALQVCGRLPFMSEEPGPISTISIFHPPQV